MARTYYSLVAFLQLMLTVAQVTAVNLDVGPALVLPPGDDATLQCNYTTAGSASSGQLTWSFNNGSSDVTFYQRLGSTEIPAAGYQGRVTFTGDLSNGIANIRLSNMTKEDSGSYTCLVIVFGDGQDSKSITVTVIEQTTAPPTTTQMTPARIPPPIRVPLVATYESQALWAAILMIAILVADKFGKFKVVKHLACFGPLLGVVLAVAVIITVCVPPNSGNADQRGFTLIAVLSGIAAGMSFNAAIFGFLFKKSGNEVNFPVATMALEFSLGLMIAISGIVVSAVDVQQGTEVPSIVVGAICLVLLIAAFIWFMVRVWCGNRQSSRGPQGNSGPSPHHETEMADTSTNS